MSPYHPKPWSVDIVSKVKYHLAFLKEVDSLTELHQVPHIQNAVRRYECMWLPLLGRHRTVTLEPPLDVHWIWHCHLLSPKAYRRDCEQLVGWIPDHALPIKDTTSQAKSLWEQDFPSEPFNIDVSTEADSAGATHASALSYDLVAAAHRQRSFYYNVSFPHYSDTKFINTAADRYARFLNLKKNNPKDFVVPMYDVDLMWHTHQLSPHAYCADTQALLGFLMNHDDAVTDRSPASKLAISDVATKELWRQTYGEEFPIPGTLYRGRSSAGNQFKFPFTSVDNITELNVDVPITAVMAIYQVTFSGGKDKYRVSGTLSGPEGHCWPVRLPPKRGSRICWRDGDTPLMYMRVDTKKNASLEGKFTRRDGIRGCLFGKELCTINIDTDDIVKGLVPTTTFMGMGKDAKVVTTRGNYSMELMVFMSSVEAKKKTLSITWGSFTDVTIPENIEELWGPVKFPRRLQDAAKKCCVASHRVEFNGHLLFTVRIIHSQSLRMSAVQVFYQDKMAVCSQLIGSEQLPAPEQVGVDSSSVHRVPTLDSKKGERGMLIKNGKGDWGIITAKWVGYTAGSRGDPEYLRGTITRLGDNQSYQYPTKADFAVTAYAWDIFHDAGVTVSHRLARVYVGHDCTEVAEMLAAAFSAGVLLLLCEPQPQLFLNNGKPTRTGRKIYGLISYDVPFFQHCGYMQPTCSNSWLYWYRHSELQQQQAAQGGFFLPDTEGQAPYCPWGPEKTSDLSKHAKEAGGGDDGGCGGDCGGCGCGDCGD